jgi:PPIC-type PPIASE domain
MRLFVTAAALVCVSGAVAQTQGVDTPVQQPTVMPKAPTARKRLRPGIAQGAAPATAKAPEVPPDTPVVTLKGVCKEPQAKGACQTVITREDLDRYIASSGPEGSGARGRLAVQYARTQAFSALAEQQGLDKNPVLAKELAAQLKLARSRILATAFLQSQQAKQITATTEIEIQKFYELHRDQYEQVQVRRLAVPVVAPTEDGRPLDRLAVKTEMEEIQKRAVAGEDLNQLQLDAYKHLHIQAAPPPLNVLTWRRGSVQGDEAKAFDLKPGEITSVLDLPAAFAVIRVESKDAAPLESVRQEIDAGLRRLRMQNQLSKFTKEVSAEFNLQYLDMPAQPDLFGGVSMTAPAPAVRGGVPRVPGTRP